MISIKNLWQRDGGTCYLCGLATTKANSRNTRLAPTRDHVVPVSLGGQNTSDNLRLAHKLCNEKRGQMDVDEFRAVGFQPVRKLSKKEQERRKAAEERRQRREQILRVIQNG